MFVFPIFRPQNDRPQNDRPSKHRPLARLHPLVEALEGRQLLSTIVQGSHIGTNVSPAIVGNHIG